MSKLKIKNNIIDKSVLQLYNAQIIQFIADDLGVSLSKAKELHLNKYRKVRRNNHDRKQNYSDL